MSSRQDAFDDIYTNRWSGRHPPTTVSQTLVDKLNEPTVVVSAVLLALSILYNLYSSSAAFEETVFGLIRYIWDALVSATPSQVILGIDNYFNPASAQMADPSLSLHAAKSAAMRRVLGVERGRGLMASVFQARTRALSITGGALGLKLDTERPAGLGNRDNSCFQNSILQGLASLQTLPDYLSTCLQNAEADDDKEKRAMAQTLRALLSDLNDTSNNGRTLWTPEKLKTLNTLDQQDAQEYFSKVLDDIDKGAAHARKFTEKHQGFESDSKDATGSQHSDDSGYQSSNGSNASSDATSFRNPLEGLLAQRVACINCGHSDGLSMIPFNCLTLSLGLQGQHDLYERLDSYSHMESIEGVECPKCTLLKAKRLLTKLVDDLRSKGANEQLLAEPTRRLEAVELALEEDHFDDKTIKDECKISSGSKVSSTKTKQVVIARPPQSLAIHVNRSVFSMTTGDIIKNSAPVTFPMTLDLGPWCLGSALGAGGSQQDPVDISAANLSEEQWMQDPKASMIAGDMGPSRLSGPIYQLRAVVTHSGRHDNGHYICWRKFPRTEPKAAEPSTPAGTQKEEDADPGNEDAISTTPEVTEADQDDESAMEPEMDWWRLSDHNVAKFDAPTVLSQAPGVFMLFYDCVDPSIILQDLSEDSTPAAAETPEGADAQVEDMQLQQGSEPSPVAAISEAGLGEKTETQRTDSADPPEDGDKSQG